MTEILLRTASRIYNMHPKKPQSLVRHFKVIPFLPVVSKFDFHIFLLVERWKNTDITCFSLHVCMVSST